MSNAMNNSRVCHFKLVLLGDTAVGKSCLVVRFVRDEFFEFQEPTIGGEFLFVLTRLYRDRGVVVPEEGFLTELFLVPLVAYNFWNSFP